MHRSSILVVFPLGVALAALPSCIGEMRDNWVIAGAGGATTGSSGAAGSSVEGLPCDVADLLETECIACHGQPLTNNAPMPLLTYEDLVSPSVSDPARTVAELCLARMSDAAAPMPPGGLLPAESVAPFDAWVASGMPPGECSGAGGAGGAPVVCTSEVYWTEEMDDGPEMRPGEACIHCHASEVEVGEDPPPLFLIAGTVYPTVHEPDDCFGAAGAVIEVTDAIGRKVVMTSNAAGNFIYEGDPGAVTMPIEAKLSFGGKTRAMAGKVDSGDCNGCHTQDGAEMAPGRIELP